MRVEAHVRKALVPISLLVLVAAAVLTLTATGPGSAPPDPAPVADEEEASGGSPPEPGPARFRPEDLFSEDPGRALAAAAALSPAILTLEELRRQQALLVDHPRVWHESRADWGVGNVEIPRLLLRCAEEDYVPRDAEGRVQMHGSHRVFLPSSMEGVVEALGRSGPETFPELLGYLEGRAQVSGARFEEAARGFLYGIARLRAGERGEVPPPLDVFLVDRPAKGLPEAFLTLARFAWLEEGTKELLPRSTPLPPHIFLLRWGRKLEPSPVDVPFLADLARRGGFEEARGWAVTALGELRVGAAEATVRDLARREDRVAALAAAALARWGEPDRLRELVGAGEAGELAAVLRYRLFPEEASPPPDLLSADHEDRANWEAWWGIRLTDRELLASGEAFAATVSDPFSLLRYCKSLGSDALHGAALDRLLEGLHAFASWEEAWEEYADDLARLLAPLEVRAPERLRDLLAHWAERAPEPLRGSALELLARLGDGRFVPEMIRAFEETADDFPFDDLRLGRVRDPRVGKYLLGASRSEDADLRSSALHALAEHHGLPPEFFGHAPVDERSAEHIRSGDPVGAFADAVEALTLLGLVDDPRIRKLLERRREERSVEQDGDVVSVYWEATAGLALLGDERARAEIRGAIEDGRTWILELVDHGAALALDADPDMVRLWTSRIDANCCHGLLALDVLSQTFPLLDTDYHLGNMAEVRSRIERWYARHEGRFAWSRLVDGWVAR
jgi:hypothetical protein